MALSIGELGESNDEEEVMDGVKIGPEVHLVFALKNNMCSTSYGLSSCVFSWSVQWLPRLVN